MLSLTNKEIKPSEMIQSVSGVDPVTVLTQTQAHPSMSKRYGYMGTADVIRIMTDNGFTHKLIREERSRKPEYRGFATHLISFEHPDISLSDPSLKNELRPMFLFKNSFHGRTKVVFDIGLLRQVCTNGLMLGLFEAGLTLKHIGLNPQKLEETIVKMREAFNNDVVQSVNGLKETILTSEQQVAFAETAIRERLRTIEGIVDYQPKQLLAVHRDEDAGDSAWLIWNRVQENMGLNFRSSPIELSYRQQVSNEDGSIETKERKIRSVNNIGEVTHLNQFLYRKIREFVPDQQVDLMAA